ncbi:MAG: BACON domain-containing protein [Bacteroidales bacterium]|nr:BACON domain-containing protein [Bacteroidales bacterium]
MKRIILILILFLFEVLPINAQSPAFSFIFNEVKFGENSKFASGSGQVIIYDNQSISFSGVSNTGKSFKYSFSFNSLSIWLDGSMFRVHSDKSTDTDKAPNIMISLQGVTAHYSDPATGLEISMYDGAKMNENMMEACVTALKNHTGVFRNFKSEEDIELPPTIEGYSTTRKVKLPAGGGDEVFKVRTKTDKMIRDTKWHDYTVTADAYWCDIQYKTDAAFLIRTDANTTGSSRTATVTVEVGGKKTQMIVTQPSLTAKILSVWVDHNQFSGLVKGMRIHVKFETYNVRGVSGQCAAYFYFSDGTKLLDYNYQYRSIDGQVSVGSSFIPGYDSAIYNDFVLFMPYTELHINGSAKCKFHVDVRIGGELAQSEDIFFNFN